MELWRKVYREGIAPIMSTKSLETLAEALRTDDQRLIQGATTTPPPLACVQDWPVEAACALSFCGWQGEALKTVAEVEEFFAHTCFAIDQLLDEPAACRHFLNAYDDWSRQEMIQNLLPEVKRTLANRSMGQSSQGAIDVDVAPISGVDL